MQVCTNHKGLNSIFKMSLRVEEIKHREQWFMGRAQYDHTLLNFITKQECFPVGCVLRASMDISTKGVSVSGAGGYEVDPFHHTPRGQTDRYKNITLPHISFAGGNQRVSFPLYLLNPKLWTMHMFSVKFMVRY